nr:MAG TPA: TM2 domain [Caudoviricetes sp.]
MSENKKRKIITFVLCLFFGMYGIHKFYQKKIGLGILYLFTLGIFGFGWLVDAILLLIDLIKPENVQAPDLTQPSELQGNVVREQSPVTEKPKRSRKTALICALAGIPVVIIALIVIIGSTGSSEPKKEPLKIDSTTAPQNYTITTEPATTTIAPLPSATTKSVTTTQTKPVKTESSSNASSGNAAGGSSSNSSKPKTTTTTKRITTQKTDPPKTASPTPSTYTYIVNTSTGVFHYSYCRHVKRMDEENKLEVNTTSEKLKAEGYTPCGTCNP